MPHAPVPLPCCHHPSLSPTQYAGTRSGVLLDTLGPQDFFAELALLPVPSTRGLDKELREELLAGNRWRAPFTATALIACELYEARGVWGLPHGGSVPVEVELALVPRQHHTLLAMEHHTTPPLQTCSCGQKTLHGCCRTIPRYQRSWRRRAPGALGGGGTPGMDAAVPAAVCALD